MQCWCMACFFPSPQPRACHEKQHMPTSGLVRATHALDMIGGSGASGTRGSTRPENALLPATTGYSEDAAGVGVAAGDTGGVR